MPLRPPAPSFAARLRRYTLAAACCCSLSALALTPPPPLAPELEQTLQQLSQWQPGQPDACLARLDAAVRASHNDPALQQQLAARLAYLLRTVPTTQAIAAIARQLAIIGNEDAAAALLPFLERPDTAEEVRYALERIPGDTIDQGLIEALPKAPAPARPGILNTLGLRRTPRALAPLAQIARDANAPDEERRAAIRALAQIPAEDAATILDQLRPTLKGELRRTADAALLERGYQLAEQGRTQQALACFTAAHQTAQDPAARTAAQRALIEHDPDTPTQRFQDALRSKQPEAQRAALAAFQHQPQRYPLQPIAEALDNAPDARRFPLLAALQRAGDPAANQRLLHELNAPERTRRMLAIRMLGFHGDADIVAPLIQYITAQNTTDWKPEQAAARIALAELEAPGVREQLLALARTAPPDQLREIIHALPIHMDPSLFPQVLAWARHNDPEVRAAAFRVLAALAPAELLPQLLDLLFAAPSQEDRYKAILAITRAAAQIPDQNQRSAPILQKLPQAPTPEARAAVCNILGQIADPPAIQTLCRIARENRGDDRTNAVRALAASANPAAAEELLHVARTPQNDTERSIALEGYFRVLRAAANPQDPALPEAFQNGLDLVQTRSERKKALAAFAEIGSLAKLHLVAPLLNDPEMRDEAAAALHRLFTRSIALRPSHGDPEDAQKALDGTINTPWMCDAPPGEEAWLDLDFGLPLQLDTLTLDTSPVPNRCPPVLEAYISQDGELWGAPPLQLEPVPPLARLDFKGASARFLRLRVPPQAQGIRWSIHELHLFDPDTGQLGIHAPDSPRPAPPAAATAPAAPSHPLAAAQWPEGWTPQAPPAFYTPNNLYELINGEAETFMPYRFQRLTVLLLRHTDATRVQIEAYEMGSPLDAFGIYSTYRRHDDDFVPIHRTEAMIGTTQIVFPCERYFVKIYFLDATGERDALLHIAEATAHALPPHPGTPPELELLNLPGRIPRSEQYIARDFQAYAFFKRGLQADIATEDNTTLRVYVVLLDSPEEAQQALRAYQQELKNINATSENRATPNGEALLITAPAFEQGALLQRGRLLCGVAAPGTPPQKILPLLEQLAANADQFNHHPPHATP